MDKRIDLITYNQRRMLPLALLIVLVIVAMFCGSIVLLKEAPMPLAVVIATAVFAGGIYGMLKLLKKLGAEPLSIQLGTSELTIHNQKTNIEQRIAYADITAYRFSNYNQTEELRLTLKNAGKIKISVNSQLHNNQGLAELMHEFEHRLAAHQELQADQAPATLREKSFFEKPLSTVLLAILSAAILYLAWMMYRSPKPIQGNAITSIGFYLTYVAAWYAARERRAAKA